MHSEIQEFYKNKTIFLTGASGFLGRVIVEKLLRATEVSRIYVLLRPKREKNTQERLEVWKTDPLFGLLLKTKPNVLDRVVCISGDCNAPDLGISLEDLKLLKKETQVVIHSAATVNFAEPLHVALDTNTRATHLMLQLSKEMGRLVAFVHVSTAFSNCVIHHITERYYPGHLSCSVDKVLKVREMCDNNLIDSMAPALLDKFPNTYTYTKALAEQLVQTEAANLPVCIFRPGSIVATSMEPMPGWIDNIYGPIAMVYGAAFGVLRVAPISGKAIANIVPVDFCANIILASAWKTAKETAGRSPQTRTSLPPTIYNYVPNEKNLITNDDFTDYVDRHRYIFPLRKAIWYPYLISFSIQWVFKLAAIFYHLIPGYLIDFGLWAQGKKTRMIKMYSKIHKTMDALSPFSTKNWSFETANTDRLWQSLSPVDKKLFDFDMKSLSWDAYFIRALAGMRIYLGKEDPSEESLELGKKHMQRLHVLHRVLQFSICCGVVATAKWLHSLFL
ncbi:fatty acyl-CoA reductase wat-like [Drosophila innubila]|uniref:fatty acyl-CoA reductase wat-like n=1 Tax=Drosophila innubila TaxID=198719 RepID=UPI00148C4DB4|nr:fatty acyl-CoA reductase wat-like [Drosophila innubila]